MSLSDSLFLVAGVGFIGGALYSFVIMFYVLRDYDSSMSKEEFLKIIPGWVKLLGITSGVIFLAALALLAILRP